MNTCETSREQYLSRLVAVVDSQFFKALSEPVRVEILKFLFLNGKSDIRTVALSIKKDRSVISRHMHLLAEAGLLRTEKVSRNVYFEIDGQSFLDKARAFFNEVNQVIQSCCSES